MKVCKMICNDITSNNCKDLAKLLNEFRKVKVIIVVGRMSIEYSGRAASYAEEADRLLIVKPDGTLLVHEATKRDPLNWQPPGSTILFECVGDSLRVISIRSSPREEVIIDITKIEFIKACKLASTRLTVIGTEADIVAMIASNPRLIDLQAELVGCNIPTPYGKVDVLLKKKDGTLLIVEVKNERAGVSAVAQLKRYVEYYKGKGYNAIGILVAPSLSEEAQTLIAKEGFRFVSTKGFAFKPRTTLETYFKSSEVK